MYKLLRHDTEPTEMQPSVQTHRGHCDNFDSNKITYGLFSSYSRPFSCFVANKTFIMDLIDRSRTRARGMETNYVAVTGSLSALDT